MLLPIHILVTSDPATSGAPAEAIRIAAALCGWGQLQVTLCLHGPAANILHDPETPILERQLKTLSDLAGPILLCDAHFTETGDYFTQNITAQKLAQQLGDSRYTLRF